MNENVWSRDSLLLIPCCAAKLAGGRAGVERHDPLDGLISALAHAGILRARGQVFGAMQTAAKYTTATYEKNVSIVDDADIGGAADIGGSTMPALDRYVGSLYSASGLKAGIRKAVESADGPKVLILSALYGPLHPLSEIQDYNLMMSDAPAKVWRSAFPDFLEDYARTNSIRNIHLYVGTSTAYFSVAKKASQRLLTRGVIEGAIQYHVVKGSTRETPSKHGALLSAQLAGIDASHFFTSTSIVAKRL